MSISKTAVVLVTYGQWEKTELCLKDLRTLPENRFRIFVVDNGSADGTPQNIEREFPEVRLLCPQANLGFGAANNRGVELARKSGERFDSILLLNNDTRIPQGTLEALQGDLTRFPNDVVVPRLRNADGSVQKNWFSEISHPQFFLNAFRTQKAAERYVHGKTIPIPNTPFREARWTNAAAWLMTVETWERVGGFDENFFMYYEDVDWAYRAREKGIRFLIDTENSIVHLDGGSAKSALSRSMQHDSSQLYFYRKHFGFGGALLSRAFRFVRSLVRMTVLAPKTPFSEAARKNVKIHFYLLLLSMGFLKCHRK